MIFFYFVQWSVIAIAALAVISQIVIPLFTGRPMFSWFRGSPKEALNASETLEAGVSMGKAATNLVADAGKTAVEEVKAATRVVAGSTKVIDKTKKILKKD